MTHMTKTQPKLFTSLFALVTAVALAGPTSVAFSAVDDDPMSAPDGTTAPPKGKRPPRGGQKPDSGGMLSGPEVPPEAGQGNGAFGAADGKKGQRQGQAGGPMQEVRLFMGALASIDTQLTDEQRTQIQAIRSDVEGKMKAWKDANGEQLSKLEEKMRGARGNGKGANPGAEPQGPPPQDGQKGPPGGAGKPDKATMEEMQKLRETMPKMDAARDSIMAILTPAQQETLKSNMVGMRKAMDKREGGKGPGGKGPGGKGPGGKGPGGKGGDGSPEKAPPPADPPKGDYKFPPQ